MKTSQRTAAATPAARAMLDIGRGAGNFTMKSFDVIVAAAALHHLRDEV